MHIVVQPKIKQRIFPLQKHKPQRIQHCNIMIDLILSLTPTFCDLSSRPLHIIYSLSLPQQFKLHSIRQYQMNITRILPFVRAIRNQYQSQQNLTNIYVRRMNHLMISVELIVSIHVRSRLLLVLKKNVEIQIQKLQTKIC